MEKKQNSKMKPTNINCTPGQSQKRKGKRGKGKLDPNCQEATPEILRIEIEQIFKEFLGNPDQEEFIFPSNLNNLQRKFIHDKAQKLNLTSKSYGKEPNRQIHIKKKSNQCANMSFNIIPGKATLQCVQEFTYDIGHLDPMPPTCNIYEERNRSSLWNSQLSVPSKAHLSHEISEIRSKLPIFDNKQEIISAINLNQITIISSETGSGKTTQVPQYIMEYMREINQPCKIICTQPRRISTIAAAERVAYERGETVGSTVGYHIKLEQKYGIKTNLIYCTTGVFVRNLMSGGKNLKNISHVILDEVHERDKLSDFVLICLKQILPMNPKIRIILMSATLTAKKFQDYFGSGHILHVPGRIYPITTLYLEDILNFTNFMSTKMKLLEQKLKEKSANENVAVNQIKLLNEVDEAVDEALDDYLHFSENYDYKVHYEEATAQLKMYFLSEGISVDYQHSKSGRTALMIASSLGDKEFITCLCNMGANMDICDEMGKDAFDYAFNNNDTMQLLDYIKIHRRKFNSNEEENKGQKLLELYDKTTSDNNIDFDLIVNVIICIHNTKEPGAILVFLPGYDDIILASENILASTLDPTTIRIFFLHSSMNIRDQHDVFKKISNQRKIILSTNIAETSLTIDDVSFVIDTGKCKQKCYDSYNKVSSLQTCWISQACAEQRKGRSGRTGCGVTFRLYSRQRYDNMDKEKVPEMLRVSLEEICLHAKILAPQHMNIYNFLMLALDAPSANSIKVAIENLQFLEALDEEEDLTRLGRYLAQLTTDPHIGKILLYSVIFKCLDPVLTLVASMSHKDPFQLPAQANLRSSAAEYRKKLLNGYISDHLLYLQIFRQWQEQSVNGKGHEFCRKHFLSYPTMNSILETRSQLLAQLRSINFIHQSHNLDLYNMNSDSWPVVKAIISTGLYPNLAYPKNGTLANRREKKIFIHYSSSCYKQPVVGHWLMYDEMIKQHSHMFIRGVSPISTLSVALMCGNNVIYPTPNTILIDDWIEFQYPFPELNNLRKMMTYLIKNIMITPYYRYQECDTKALTALKNILNIEEDIINLSYPQDIGRRPRFLIPLKKHDARKLNNSQHIGQNGRTTNDNARNSCKPSNHVQREDWRKPSSSQDNSRRPNGYSRMANFTKNNQTVNSISENISRENRNPEGGTCTRQSYSNGIQYGVVGGRSTGALFRNGSDTSNSPERQNFGPIQRPTNFTAKLNKSVDPATKLMQALICEDVDPATRLLNGLTVGSCSGRTVNGTTKRYGNYPDEKIYVLIKPRGISNVNIAYDSSKWVFAPQTEKKILYYVKDGREVYMIFTVPTTYTIQGIAQFIDIDIEMNGKPTATIKWLYKSAILNSQVRHLKNPYNDDEPIYSGPDGQIVKQNVAEELCRIFEAKIDSENWSASRNSTEPSTSRGIRSSSHLNPNHNHSRKNTEFY